MLEEPPKEEGHFSTGTGHMHQAPSEWLRLDKYHVLWVLEKLRADERLRPRADGWLWTLALCVTVVLGMVTADFHDWIGLSKDTWRAIFAILAVGFLGLSVWLFVRWITRRVPVKTPQEIVDGMINDLARDRAKASGQGESAQSQK